MTDEAAASGEQRLHQLYELSVWLKIVFALIEFCCGVLLILVSHEEILALVAALTQHELVANPHDLIAGFLHDLAAGFSVSTQHFYALYLIAHGVVKVVLMAGLLSRRRMAFPVALVGMGLMLAYEIYRYTETHGLLLVWLAAFDIFLIGLIWHEGRKMGAFASSLSRR